MTVAFYAPLKPPDAPTPSGDRRVARLLIQALNLGGRPVEIAARLRTRVADGDLHRQIRFAELGERLAHRFVARVRAGRRPRPDLWMTYHLYYKAPDTIGPLVADALSIPYVVAEASVAHKRAGGPWDQGHRAVLSALARADLVIGFNRRDRVLVTPELKAGAGYLDLPPFLDTAELPDPAVNPAAGSTADPTTCPELLAVGMMRPGDKTESFLVLAQAMAAVPPPWRLTLVGDGPSRPEIAASFARFGDQVRFAGQLDESALRACYAESDLLVWPAINEAFGMALLEAQGSGLPVVAGAAGDVAAIVRHGETGLLAPEGDAAAFAGAVSDLLADSDRRRAMARLAASVVRRDHSRESAAARLGAALADLVPERPACVSP